MASFQHSTTSAKKRARTDCLCAEIGVFRSKSNEKHDREVIEWRSSAMKWKNEEERQEDKMAGEGWCELQAIDSGQTILNEQGACTKAN
jgi:hypothetical protein